jgi:hypothetical protein
MEGLIINITVIVVSFCGGEYRFELILNVTEFYLRGSGKRNLWSN